MTDKPHKIRDGRLAVTVWENTSEEGKVFYSTTLVRSYKDGEDWKETTSLNENDLLKSARLLNKAFDHIQSQKVAK